MLTQDQDAALRFIANSIKTEGFSPSIWEVANAMGCPYVTARKTMMKLDELGFIKRRYNRPRSITVLRWPNEAKAAA